MVFLLTRIDADDQGYSHTGWYGLNMSVSRTSSGTRRSALAIPLFLAPLLASCAAMPDLGSRPALRTPATVAAGQSLSGAPAGAWPGDGWWLVYGDRQLAALIEEGLRNSPDVAAAAARFHRAAGYAQQAGAALLPSVDAQGKAGYDKQSYNQGFPKEFLPHGWIDNGRAALDLSFDIARRRDVRCQGGRTRFPASRDDARHGHCRCLCRSGAALCGARYPAGRARNSQRHAEVGQ
jgi:uncharacterized membrane protein